LKKFIKYGKDDENTNNPIDRNRPTKKLTPRFTGPYTIVKVISPVVYKLNLPETMKIHPVFHVSLLKPYQPSPDEFARPIPPPAIVESDTGQEEYEVEAILDKRIIRKKTQYLVKWVGYPLHDATWEPVRNLSNAPEIIKEFELTRTSNLKEGRM